jgi:hypothetical protein
MTTLRQKISKRVLADDERAIQSTFVYQCRLLDGLEREYELLEHDVRQLLDLLGVPDAVGGRRYALRDRLHLALDTKEFIHRSEFR